MFFKFIVEKIECAFFFFFNYFWGQRFVIVSDDLTLVLGAEKKNVKHQDILKPAEMLLTTRCSSAYSIILSCSGMLGCPRACSKIN